MAFDLPSFLPLAAWLLLGMLSLVLFFGVVRPSLFRRLAVFFLTAHNKCSERGHLALVAEEPPIYLWKLNGPKSGKLGHPIKEPSSNARFMLVRPIAHNGRTAQMFIGRDVQLQRTVAIKVMHRPGRRLYETELAILARFQNERQTNIIRMIDNFMVDGYLHIAFEFIAGGDLRRCPRGWNIAKIRSCAKALLVAVDALHSIDFIHCDLKPKNVLLSADMSTLRLISFSHVRLDSDQSEAGYEPSAYVAPEVLRARSVGSKASDMWSIGCILAKMALNRSIFSVNEEECFPEQRLGRIDQGLVDLDATLSRCENATLADLIQKCLRPNPHERISAQKALDHPFFQ